MLHWHAAESYTSSHVIAEIQAGISSLADGAKKRALQQWLNRLVEAMEGRILNFNTTVATVWGRQEAEFAAKSCPMPMPDSFIAATARRHSLTIVTRNTTVVQSLHRSRVLRTILAMSNSKKISRRRALGSSGLIVTAALTGSKVMAAEKIGSTASTHERPAGDSGPHEGAPFVFCLNTSTIRGQKLGLAKEIELAAQAGFQAIEPWIGTIEEYVKGGGSLKDLKKKIADLGMTVESAIGFPEWIVDDEARRAKGMEQAKREMDLVAQIGGKRLAAPPSGATNEPKLDLMKAAERYRALLEAGDAIGVTPELELWGFSKNLHLLSEVAYVAIQTGHPKACVLTDVFHLYKGGSDFRSIRLLSAQAIQLVHLNDFPADPPREKIDDSYRVLPGDGAAPLKQFLQDLHSTGNGKVLSLELFNRKLWAQDALQVLKEGLAKMQAVVKSATGA